MRHSIYRFGDCRIDLSGRELRRAQAFPLLLLGLAMALLAHVPFVGLLAPSLAALAYIHFGLEALRRQRKGAVVTVIDNQEGKA